MPPSKRAPAKRTPAKKPTARTTQGRARVKAPPAATTPSDELEVRPDGIVRWRLSNGDTYWLRRPTAGEYLDLEELMELMQDETRTEQAELIAALEKARKLKAKAAVTASIEDIDARLKDFAKRSRDRTVKWWSAVFATLEFEGRPFPVRDVPMDIFSSPDRQVAIREGWLRPSGPGA